MTVCLNGKELFFHPYGYTGFFVELQGLNTGAEILLFDNPTQGIDVGAKTEIYRLMEKLAGQGKTILFTSMEVPEIRKVADLCHVFYNGSIIGTLSNDQIDETSVMRYSTNSIGAQQPGRGGEL